MDHKLELEASGSVGDIFSRSVGEAAANRCRTGCSCGRPGWRELGGGLH